MLRRFTKFWDKITQIDTPLVSKEYVEKTVHLLYWLGLVIAAAGFVAGVIAWIVDGQFVHFVIVTSGGLGVWLGLIVICCFLTLGVLKVTEFEKRNRLKQMEMKSQEAKQVEEIPVVEDEIKGKQKKRR